DDEPPPSSDTPPSTDPIPVPPEPEPPKPPPEATPSLLATLQGIHFEFDKALPLASVIDTCRDVATRAAAEPERPIVIVGHTDNKGTKDYNLKLSNERARTISAFLRDDVEEWMKFYDHP